MNQAADNTQAADATLLVVADKSVAKKQSAKPMQRESEIRARERIFKPTANIPRRVPIQPATFLNAQDGTRSIANDRLDVGPQTTERFSEPAATDNDELRLLLQSSVAHHMRNGSSLHLKIPVGPRGLLQFHDLFLGGIGQKSTRVCVLQVWDRVYQKNIGLINRGQIGGSFQNTSCVGGTVDSAHYVVDLCRLLGCRSLSMRHSPNGTRVIMQHF